MANDLPEPASRKEQFLAKAAGVDGITLPEPASREEEYLNAIAEGGGGGGGTTYTAGDGITISDDTISVDLAQTTGSNSKKVMSQDATTGMIFRDKSTKKQLQIGDNSNASGTEATAVGSNATASGIASVAIGGQCQATAQNSIAFAQGQATVQGEFNVGTSYNWSSGGFNNTAYRVIRGVHDPVEAHDAATKGYVDANAGSGGITFLSSSNFNYDSGSGSPDSVAMWLLDDGLYFMPSNYSTTPVIGCLNGTEAARFNSDVANDYFFFFIKKSNCFWLFVNPSNQDNTIYANRPIYFCKINPANGWFTFDSSYQLKTRNET